MKGVVSSQTLTNLQDGVNTALAALGTSESTVYNKIAFVDDGSATNGNILGKVTGMFDNGDGTSGEVVRYPFSPVSNAPEEWAFGDERGEVDEVIQYIEISRARHKVKDSRVYVDTQDVYGVISGKIPAIMQRASLLWDIKLAAAINANGTCFDGKAMFATDHPVDPNDASKGTYSNTTTATSMDETGLATALDLYAKIPWADGVVRNSELRKPILICPTAALTLKARQLVFGSLIPSAGAGGVATGSSMFSGMIEDVIHWQMLVNSDADSSKYCYLISPGTPAKAAFIVSPKRPPTFHISGIDPSEEIRRKFGAVAYGWDAFGGVGLGLPQDAVRIKIG